MARCEHDRGTGLQRGRTHVYWHPRDWTLGAWLAVAYITLFLGSVLAGVVYHSGRPEGIVLGYVSALILAILILPFSGGRRKRRSR